MASMYKRTGRSSWTVSWSEGGRTRTRSFHYKGTAGKFRDQMQELEEAVAAGVKGLDSMRRAEAAGKPITDHLDSYHKDLVASGDTQKHADYTRSLIKRVFEAGGIDRISDITQAAVRCALDQFRQTGIRTESRSLRTANAALTACKAFSRWLRKNRLSATHELEDMEGWNIKTDKRLVRRALSEDEIGKLLATAEASSTRRMMLDGVDRSMCYRTAIATGFRLNEIRSLTVESFHLAGSTPFVRLAAIVAKDRDDVDQYIAPATAAVLAAWIKGKQGQAFPIGPFCNAALAVRGDCRDAGIPTAGVDFHALRYTGITIVARACGLRVAQAWARHSTPLLTARYSPPEMVDRTAAAAALPSMERPGSAGGSEFGKRTA